MDETCSCGLALEDPLHYGYHRIIKWNEMVFAASRKKAEKEFDKRVEDKPKKRSKDSWTSLDI